MVTWRPVPMSAADAGAFDGVREFHTSYWAGPAFGRHSGESVTLTTTPLPAAVPGEPRGVSPRMPAQ